MAITQAEVGVGNLGVDEVIVPEIFTPYIQQLTEIKSRLVQSGALARNLLLDQMLAAGGLTFNIPSFRDLDDTADNVSGQAAADIQRLIATAAELSIGSPNTIQDARPLATRADVEIAARLNRNQSWSSADLAANLAGSDPMTSIGNRVADYWLRKLQAIYIATFNGVFKDNGVNDSGDYTNEIVGASFVDGVTNFSAEAFIDAKVTMGDSQTDLAILMVHSVVEARMLKNDLIDFIPDSTGKIQIPTFQGLEVIVDDGLPSGTGVTLADGTTAGDAGMYESWIMGTASAQLGVGSATVPTEVSREALAGNGGGQSVLTDRKVWSIHPTGHAVSNVTNEGGLTNAELATAANWNRVYPERKQIKIARLITREA